MSNKWKGTISKKNGCKVLIAKPAKPTAWNRIMIKMSMVDLSALTLYALSIHWFW